MYADRNNPVEKEILDTREKKNQRTVLKNRGVEIQITHVSMGLWWEEGGNFCCKYIEKPGERYHCRYHCRQLINLMVER